MLANAFDKSLRYWVFKTRCHSNPFRVGAITTTIFAGLLGEFLGWSFQPLSGWRYYDDECDFVKPLILFWSFQPLSGWRYYDAVDDLLNFADQCYGHSNPFRVGAITTPHGFL